MLGRVLDYGHFEYLESERGRTLLVLNQANVYSWTREKAMEILRLTESSEKSGDRHYKIASEGPYFIINVEDDGLYPNLPHLYLKHMNHYDEFIIQDGLPDLLDYQKEIIRTNRIVPAEEVETFAYQKY